MNRLLREAADPHAGSAAQTLTQDETVIDTTFQLSSKRPKLLFLVTEDGFFWSHRLPIARAAARSGFEVIVVARDLGHAQHIRAEGFRFIHWHLIRKSFSPRKELRAVRQLVHIYRTEQPDIAHHVAIKPVLYGSLVALGQQNMRVVNAFTGLGYLVSSSSLKAKLLRMAVWRGLQFVLNRPRQRVLLQNEDDKQLLVTNLRVPPDQTAVIRGSGVDVSVFRPGPEPPGPPIVLLACRMLWIKGIAEFVEAARLLRANGCTARFVLAGDSDPSNPSGVPRKKLLEWRASGEVEWWGHQQEMARVLQQATLVCLPSHGGEGVPKILLEAAASARAIVTTDVPGCRDIVRQGVNGIIVPPRNVAALAAALEQLLKDPVRRGQMASRGREIAAGEFSQEAVAEQTLALYRELLGSCETRTAAHAAV